METGHSDWSLGTLVAFPIMLLIIVGLIGLGVFLILYARRQDAYWGGEATFGAVVCFIAAFGFALGTAVGMYPYGSQYHQWRTTEGTIDTISSRFLGSGDGTTQRFVVRFTTGNIRSCDDTRCALYKPGDRIVLSCKREWQFSGTDGWSCNYKGGSREGRG